MVTNYPHLMRATDGLPPTAGHAGTGVAGRALEHLRQMVCGLRGHDRLLHFEEERMSLRCVSCGHETPGWTLNQAPPSVTVRGDARRHALVRPKLVSERRIA
jgi:hypothetical protein